MHAQAPPHESQGELIWDNDWASIAFRSSLALNIRAEEDHLIRYYVVMPLPTCPPSLLSLSSGLWPYCLEQAVRFLISDLGFRLYLNCHSVRLQRPSLVSSYHPKLGVLSYVLF